MGSEMCIRDSLQCDTSAMSFTSAVLLGDEDEKKNGKVRVTEPFVALFGELVEFGSPLC